MTIRVGVTGAGGRMGSTVCRAVADAPDLELVAAVDPHHDGLDVHQVTGCALDLEIAAGPEAFIHAAAEVVVDFTVADAARENLRWLANNGIHAVVGTTGLGADDLVELAEVFTDSNCVLAPNFAIGAVLMMRFAELAAPFFDTAEVVEIHHEAKADAPSGTAMLTAERMAAASGTWVADATGHEVLPGARGATGPAGIHVHSLRMRGAVAHQEVVLGTDGQTLTIRHDSLDRSSFMPGVLLAVRRIHEFPGVTVGLDPFLDL